jgi:Holliday junction resolvasome RuvABC endonuclease subunit
VAPNLCCWCIQRQITTVYCFTRRKASVALAGAGRSKKQDAAAMLEGEFNVVPELGSFGDFLFECIRHV